MKQNAKHVETECSILSGPPDWQNPVNHKDSGNYLCHRLKLLSKMITAVAKGVPIGDHRKQAMRDNLTAIDKLLGGNGWKRKTISLRMLQQYC
jgi:hypothetical protein